MKEGASYQDLLAGHQRFKSGSFADKKDLFTQLASGQKPHVTFITCSDSRIDPCNITQTQAGDLFVIRNAGNIVPKVDGKSGGEVATLEFAVCGLKTEHIVVCGHTDCGAMKGLLAPEKCAHLTHLSAWVREAQDALVSLDLEGMDPADQLRGVIEANVKLQIEHLRSLDFVKEAEAAGNLTLHGWVYEIGTGDIHQIDTGGGKKDSTIEAA